MFPRAYKILCIQCLTFQSKMKCHKVFMDYCYFVNGKKLCCKMLYFLRTRMPNKFCCINVCVVLSRHSFIGLNPGGVENVGVILSRQRTFCSVVARPGLDRHLACLRTPAGLARPGVFRARVGSARLLAP